MLLLLLRCSQLCSYSSSRCPGLLPVLLCHAQLHRLLEGTYAVQCCIQKMWLGGGKTESFQNVGGGAKVYTMYKLYKSLGGSKSSPRGGQRPPTCHPKCSSHMCVCVYESLLMGNMFRNKTLIDSRDAFDN